MSQAATFALAFGLLTASPPERSAGPVVVFFCDFGAYPPRGNVAFAAEECDHSIAFDDRPHLRLPVPRRSRVLFRLALPRAPAEATLEAMHLASAGPDGAGDATISISVNGKPLASDWNVSKTSFAESRWDATGLLASGENEIEWRAGNLRTHYWLRRVELRVAFAGEVEVAFRAPEPEHALFWEGRFSQCSYNALATVLDRFYGVEPWTADRDAFEKRTFVAALEPSGLAGYFGWAPWTSTMVASKTIRWNGVLVEDLQAERFELRPENVPEIRGGEAIVRYEGGERDRLEGKLLHELKRGPVILWTPYAAALDRGRDAWRHVRALDPQTDAVRFHPNFTHTVVLNLERGRIKVYDNSWPQGVWTAEARTIVGTAAAMVASVRLDRGGGKTLRGEGFPGVDGDAYNVVFFRSRAPR